MSEKKDAAAKAEQDPAAKGDALTAAAVARMVKIDEPVIGDDGKPTGETKARTLRTAEVLAFRDHGTHINVVTVAGRKHRIER